MKYLLLACFCLVSTLSKSQTMPGVTGGCILNWQNSSNIKKENSSLKKQYSQLIMFGKTSVLLLALNQDLLYVGESMQSSLSLAQTTNHPICLAFNCLSIQDKAGVLERNQFIFG